MRLEALRKSMNNLIRNSLYPRQEMNPVYHQTKPQADPISCFKMILFLLSLLLCHSYLSFLSSFLCFFLFFAITFHPFFFPPLFLCALTTCWPVNFIVILFLIVQWVTVRPILVDGLCGSVNGLQYGCAVRKCWLSNTATLLSVVY